jgi:hypothetical protein
MKIVKEQVTKEYGHAENNRKKLFLKNISLDPVSLSKKYIFGPGFAGLG